MKSVHSGTTSFRRKKSNSIRESPIPSDQTSEREHSPETLDPSDPEAEGSLLASQSYQSPSQREDSEGIDSSGGIALVSEPGERVNSQAGAVDPSDHSAFVELKTVVLAPQGGHTECRFRSVSCAYRSPLPQL